MNREYNNIYSLKVSAKFISAFSSYEMRATAKIISPKRSKKVENILNYNFECGETLSIRRLHTNNYSMKV